MGGSEGDRHPFWVAMGAAFVGTLLGGGAVWLGLQGRLDAVEAEVARVRSVPTPAAVTPAPEPALPVASVEPPADTAEPDPGDSSLVRAVERTRDSVVTIELAGEPSGSGVVYDTNGMLLTNYHVIEPVLGGRGGLLVLGDAAAAKAISVRFGDGRVRSATVLAADPDEDVAILSLLRERDEEHFHAAPLGYSASLRLGEQVFAIGSPVGFEGTIATGIISAVERTGVLGNRKLPVLQLDAAINFGNSGGPLFNLAGEIVGITTARSSRGEGIGFAIPIDHVRLFLRALERGMRGRSGVIGVVLDHRRAIAKQIEPLGYHSGVAIAEVDPGRAAALGGMKADDVIVTIRGRRHDEIDASEAGRAAFTQLVGDTIRALLPGETLTVGVVRDGELVELEIVVEAASVERQARIDAELLLGLYLAPEGDEATIVEPVRGSPIAHVPGAQVLAGARIVSLFGYPVGNVQQLGERLSLLRTWAAVGRRRSIAIGFETADGRSLIANNYPLAK
ncbi:S1C family serine protease [Enhygromyxa salina]|uniref:Periplasmic serine endoprotease DegP n=1 Tax=Enhygromyxa salina TaxID=215803 RepID=A0A2S9YQ64_9BACT|nr:trypsin-like peptidase domain-containing protein [Enhygromyxa salina]PRQ07212.1 Periplasmic serine endoprotease DegP precursor [Enhygromyxa salina]